LVVGFIANEGTIEKQDEPVARSKETMEEGKAKSSLVDVREDLRREARRRSHVGDANNFLGSLLSVSPVIVIVVRRHGVWLETRLRHGVALLLWRKLEVDEGVICKPKRRGA
jgi:hypothetical protein